MEATEQEILDIFKQTGALMRGHFILRSGLHSGYFFQCARVCEHLDCVEKLIALLLEKLPHRRFDTVLAPAMGGLVIGQELARQTHKRYLFAEKSEGSVLILRRGFKIAAGEKILLVEDVITRGGRVREALQIIEQRGGRPVGVAVLVDRSEGKMRFEVPLTSLLELSFPTYEPDHLPSALKAIPPEKPGS